MSDWPYYEDDERAAVERVLASGAVNQWTGREVTAFEREFAAFHGMPYGVALANGTLALELALHALGIGPGDEVITTPRTFVATASSIVQRGATPVFADVDATTQNLSPEAVRRKLTPRTRAILAVHLAGWPCDMDALRRLAEENGLLLIEDCAQAHGARFRGALVGCFGDAAAFSFCQDKIISTGGEGGMLLLRDEGAWRRAWSYKDHGKDYNTVFAQEHAPGFRWVHHSIGTNWRLTEMQAAIGRVQLGKLERWVRARRRNAALLAERMSGLAALRVPVPPAHVEPSYYRFYVFVRKERLAEGWTRDRIVAALQNMGVPCMHGSCSEVYLERAFDRADWRPAERLAAAMELGETSIAFHVHHRLGEADMERFADAVVDVMSRATAAR